MATRIVLECKLITDSSTQQQAQLCPDNHYLTSSEIGVSDEMPFSATEMLSSYSLPFFAALVFLFFVGLKIGAALGFLDKLR